MGMVYFDEEGDGEDRKKGVEEEGVKCVLMRGDVGEEEFWNEGVEKRVEELGGVDIVVNKGGEEDGKERIKEMRREEVERRFKRKF